MGRTVICQECKGSGRIQYEEKVDWPDAPEGEPPERVIRWRGKCERCNGHGRHRK